MFTELTIKNFKAWQGEHQVDLAPLTLFLGTNSAGKTSLLQMLLLLKQTAQSPDRKQHLNLGGQPGDLLHLGGFKDIVSEHDLRRELAFGMVIDIKERPIIYNVSYCQDARGTPVVKSFGYGGFIRDRNREGFVNTFAVERGKHGAYSLEFVDPSDNIFQFPAKMKYEPERSIALSAEVFTDLIKKSPFLTREIQDLALIIIDALKEIVYLGPLRERPLRSYAWNQQSPGDLGTKGELAIQALLASANSRTKSTRAGGSGWLVEKVSGWLQRMELADGLSLNQQGSYYEVIVHRDRIKANLADVGFGVSQVLPVVTLAYFVPEGSTVILEQPEIHLHPLAQTGLADLLVEVSKSRHVQFLVETHSEHLFRRLQSLIAEERISPEDCRLYFVKKTGRGASLEKLELDEFGRIKNWPDKFFGDAIGEVERQTRKMIERMAKQQRSDT